MPGKRHGYSRTKTYQVWASMHARCRNPNKREWKDYGGRGIKVCPEWNSFLVFLKDMGERPEGLSLDRKNNNGQYCKDNCHWATTAQQRRNLSFNRNLTVFGVSGCLFDIARYFGFRPQIIWNRLNKGWSLERAVTEPLNQVKSRAAKSRYSL